MYEFVGLAAFIAVSFYFWSIAICNKDKFEDFVNEVEQRTGKKIQYY